MTLHLIKSSLCWGGRDYKKPLYPNPEMPLWAKTAASRMKGMGLSEQQIYDTIVAMNKVRREPRLKFGDIEYEVVIE